MNELKEGLKEGATEGSKRKVPLSISTDPEIKEWVEKKAVEDERSVSIYLTRLIRDMKESEDKRLRS